MPMKRGDPEAKRQGSLVDVALRNPVLRKRAQDFGRLVRHSAVTPRTGQAHKPKLVNNGQLGLTFIGHASFFLQMGGQNILLDPNFARWLFRAQAAAAARGASSRPARRSTWCWSRTPTSTICTGRRCGPSCSTRVAAKASLR